MKKKVYITDDDQGVQDIFKIIFESAGYETLAYTGGQELLEANVPYPDLYILDKQLTGMDGLEICRSLKNDLKTKDIPVIMISATPDLAIMAKEAGADDFIEKPFRKAELLTKVSRHIEYKMHKR